MSKSMAGGALCEGEGGYARSPVANTMSESMDRGGYAGASTGAMIGARGVSVAPTPILPASVFRDDIAPQCSQSQWCRERVDRGTKEYQYWLNILTYR